MACLVAKVMMMREVGVANSLVAYAASGTLVGNLSWRVMALASGRDARFV